MTTVFGISNCDTVKKSLKWLDSKGVSYQFHDFRKDGLNRSQVESWLQALGKEKLINKRSTTWKTLPQELRDSMSDEQAIAAVLESPTLIKRPLVEHQGTFQVGFKPAEFETLFAD